MNLKHGVFCRKSPLHFLVLVYLLSNSFFSSALHAASSPGVTTEPPVVNLSKKELSARGRQESILTVSKFGRYAVTVKSDQGTGLQLIDHMAGPGEVAGGAGEKDGRLDLFLEKGRYKIVIYGHERASGAANLEAHPFTEKNYPQLPALVRYKLIESSLKDFEQISYWLEIKSRQHVALEAAGRSLSDLRLWKDGKWLLNAVPSISTVQPRTGQPLKVCRLTADLEPGLYLLSAYGGPPLPWSNDSGAYPFYLRYDIPELGSATRKRFTVSPFGADRFIVPGISTYFRLELPEAKPASLQVDRLDQGNPYNNNGERKDILNKTAPPVAEIQVGGNKDDKHIVTVTGEAGSPYILQHFESNYRYSFQGSGDYWISSVHSGHPQDSIDATAVLTSGYDTNRAQPVLTQTIELDQSTGYSRRANLLASLTLFLKVNAAGKYQVLSQGVDARFVVEPFFTYSPPNYVRPASQPGGYTWDLDAGYYILTVEPAKKGIIDLTIRPASLSATVKEAYSVLSEMAKDAVKSASGEKEAQKGRTFNAVRAAVRFPRVSLNRDRWYTMYMNLQPEVKTGLVVRPLPLDLTDPLPVTQTPGETVSVQFLASEEGTLKAEAEDGSLMEISLNNGPWQKNYNLGSGRHTVSVRSTSKDTVNYALAFEPQRLNPKASLPSMSQAALAGLPDFPVLTDDKPLFFDLERNSSSSFIIRAEKPGLYHIQSTGLLATGGNLRSRTTPSFVQESENGSGRNFSIRQYLREGDYQITVGSKGLSKGHLGLEMKHTGLIQGGFLTNRVPARVSLPAGKSAAYKFVITTPGEYRVRAFGLGRAVKCRLEDKDGWPVVTPNVPADITHRLEKGRYRLIILPESTDARIVTLIEPTPVLRRFRGHGPHNLPLAARVEHTWMEPESGKERQPDLWRFDLPAQADVNIELTGEIQGDLMRINPDKTTSKVAFILPARGWKGNLPAGAYSIDAAAMRVNNRLPYRVAVRPAQLMAGMSREVSIPAIVPVSVGQDGLVELSSFGSFDVKARLMTNEGAVIAANDDRPDDWNFHISANVKPGEYRLAVEPVGVESGSCTVSVRAPKQEEGSPITLPADAKIKLARSARFFPLNLPASGDLLVLSANAPENVSISLEVSEQGAWKTVGTSFGRSPRLEVPLRNPGSKPSGSGYRLRLSSMDRRDTVAELSAAVLSPPVFSEADLKKGIHLSSQARFAAAVRIERDGLMEMAEEYRALRWSSAPLRPCEESPRDFLAVKSGYLWVTGETRRDQGAEGLSARAERVELGQGREKAIQVRLSDNEKIHCDIGSAVVGPVLVTALSRTGRPAVELVEQGGDETVNADKMAIGEHGSLSLSMNPKKPVIRLWPASSSKGPFEVRLSQISFNNPVRTPAPEGWNGSIEGIKANSYDLPKGEKRVSLSLGEAIAAVFIKGEQIESVHWAEGAPFTEGIETAAERMVLFHMREGEDKFALDMVPLNSALATAPLTTGKPYEKIMLNSGRLRLRVAPGKSPQDDFRALHVRGGEPTFIDRSGNVLSGRDMRIGSQGGILSLEHRPGALLCWIDRPGEEALDLWRYRDKPQASSISIPASLALEGSIRSYRINEGKPVMLHVRSATPLITYLERVEKTPDVEVHSSGVAFDAYLPNGTAELRLRAFAGGSISGNVDISATPVIPTDEGLGPEVLLAPGSARLFSFKVEREGKIGAGVKADSDIVEMEILNSVGLVVGKGAAQMINLKPGAYLMKLRLPDNSAPVKARPAIVGLKVPDAGPPDEEIRRYIFSDEEMPQSFSSRHVGESRSGAVRRAAHRAVEREDEGVATEESPAEADLGEGEGFVGEDVPEGGEGE